MIAWITQLLIESWTILRESAAFILVGFLIAGVLHALLTGSRWAEWLKGLGARSVVLASAVGLPLPLCSCSVLPAAVSLRKQGASKGATLSFLISTPETSVQSVLLTYSLLGPVLAIVRPIASCITALAAGLTENFIEKRFPSEPVEESAAPSCCCGSNESEEVAPASRDWGGGLRHAFVDIFDDVVGWMLLGIVVAAVIQIAVPGFVIESVFGSPIQAMLVMLVIGVPLYVCAEASTPVAAALIVQGVSPGAALVLLLAGPATNIGSIGVLAKLLGKRTVVVYLITIAVVSVVCGLALDWFFGSRGVNLSERALAEPLVPGWAKTVGAVAFLLLCFASLLRQNALDKIVRGLDWLLPVRVTRGRMVGSMVAVAIIGYLGTGFAVIEPGQVGIIKRFGKVVRAEVPPGLCYTWPVPIGEVDRVDTRRVYRTELIGDPGAKDDTSCWVLLGDENIAKITSATHWRMQPGKAVQFAYAAADRERLVADAVRAALRSVLGAADIETVFTTDQEELGALVMAEAQSTIDRCAFGAEIVSFSFIDLHAPPEVHDAFRDIASALEDKNTRRNRALIIQAKLEALALGTKQQMLLGAKGYGLRTEAEAAGEAWRYTARLEAYRAFPELTRARLVFEMLDRVLPGMRKCIKPTGENLYLDLRFGGDMQEKDIAF